MKAEYFALFTAACWACGSVLEKKGVHLGHFTPVMGTAIRTVVSVILLIIIAAPYSKEIGSASWGSISLIAIGGGVISGALGIISLYSALKGGDLSVVMAIAFCMTPVFGLILGVTFLKERPNFYQLIGIVLCISGAAMVLYFKEHAKVA